ncbi:restriction endonuclease subunit S [Bradyrhizobium sp. 83012]|uniref:Restriction endonuclease subunit S n=1 Tax=Bradyrhizobium aeschynomenes TaxID=2734909 RepID=A0ABX2CK84_9BRAD|nr:restriction endonuclease subunit S [Bradyrhizobium aeschynomenes]NPU67764.1 restriction endonuclease subunit S [Bradyrhizobium aeschynomenes]
MNAERLLAHYEEIAEAPDAIARLRSFILDLAVRGKLVPQDPKDEPAPELLQRIGAEKLRLAAKGLIRASKQIGSKLEPPFLIPENWRWTQLAEIGVLSPRNDASDDVQASFVPMPLIAAEYGVGNGHEVRSWGEIKKGYTHFAEGDVGLAKITPCFENGKSTVFRGLTGGIGSGTTELHVVRPVFVDPDFILIFLKCPYFISTGIPKMTGTAGQKRVPTEYFAHSPFPLPPLGEQARIVAKVNELMVLCERLEAMRTARETTRDRLAAASLARLSAPDPETFQSDARFALDALPALTARPDQIKQLRQTILNLAVRGKLVPQDPNDEPAAELLRRTVSTKQIVRRSLVTISSANEPYSLPDTWKWASLDQLLVSGPQNGISPKPTNREDAPKAITLTATTSGIFDPACYKRVEAVIPEDSDFWLRDGDLLFQRGNTREYVGMSAIYRGPPNAFLFPDLMIKVRISAEVNLRFVHLASISQPARRFLSENASGAQATMPKINQSTLISLPIPLPPIAEQRRIVARVDELMALCDRLEAALAVADAGRRNLLNALLAEALAPAEDRELEAAE